MKRTNDRHGKLMFDEGTSRFYLTARVAKQSDISAHFSISNRIYSRFFCSPSVMVKKKKGSLRIRAELLLHQSRLSLQQIKICLKGIRFSLSLRCQKIL